MEYLGMPERKIEDYIVVDVEAEEGAIEKTMWNTFDEIKYSVQYRNRHGKDNVNWYAMQLGDKGEFPSKDQAYEAIVKFLLAENARYDKNWPVGSLWPPDRVYQIIEVHSQCEVIALVEPVLADNAMHFPPSTVMWPPSATSTEPNEVHHQ